jgi:diguanylate cyclase (GGDEF)-like protein
MAFVSVARPDSETRAVSLGLKALLSLGSGLLISSLVLLLSFIIEAAATHKIESQIGSELEELAFQMHDTIHRGLSERLDDIQLAATLGALGDQSASPQTRDALLHWLRHIYPEYNRIGLVDPAGHLVASTESTPAEIDLSHHDWFRGGLLGPYIGKMFPTSGLTPTHNANPRTFVDLAAPVIHDDKVVGVLGASLGWAWARRAEHSLLAPLQRRRETELIVLNADGRVVLGPAGLLENQLEMASVDAAKTGHTGHTVAIWPNGKKYVTGFTAGAANNLNPQWKGLVLVRQEAGVALGPVADMQRYLLLWGATTTTLFVLLAWFGAQWISAPLNALAAAADRLEHDSSRQLLPISARYTEIALLSHSLASLLARLRQNEHRFRTLAWCDPLTGLPNRALFRDRLTQAIAQRGRFGWPIALLSVDLDRFKNVNDTLGHSAGDQLLCEVARRLSTCLRRTDTVARLGGDEFAIILPGLQHEDGASVVARKAVVELAKPFHVDGQDVYVGASVGIAICDADGIDSDQLLRRADLALYSAKASGGRSVDYFRPSMAAEAGARQRLERDLRRAFEMERLGLHFQPEVDMHGRVLGAEALLRWRQDERWVDPTEFVAVAEASGLIVAIGSWALRKACRQAKIWRETGLPGLTIAVNVSPMQCRHGDLVDTVKRSLDEAELCPTALELEVTESIFMREEEQSVVTQLDSLRKMGIRVAIDDFGKGYSSLGRLRALPVDKVKIDRSFIARLGQEAGADAIVRAMIAIGHGLGLHVTAEGVENEYQLRLLHSAQCDSIQGFLVGRPVHAKDLKKAGQSTVLRAREQTTCARPVAPGRAPGGIRPAYARAEC